VSVLDAKLKEHGGDGHGRFILPGNPACTTILPPIPGSWQLPAGEGVCTFDRVCGRRGPVPPGIRRRSGLRF
jgi:hypothetical protein